MGRARGMDMLRIWVDKHTLIEASLAKVDWGSVRPSWDCYFMQLAKLAANRSNCMKRKVGCLVERGRRVIAMGYNGTPHGLPNCSEGGCPRCNRNEHGSLDECLCIHAEENALLECGRNGAQGATLYCSTCPCLGCAKKIVQVGLARVVYSEPYHMDNATFMLFAKAGVDVVQLE